MSQTQLRIIFESKYLSLENVLNWIRNAPGFKIEHFISDLVTKGNVLDYNEKDFSNCFTKEMSKKAPVFITLLDLNGNKIMLNKGRDAASLIINLSNITRVELQDWIAYTDGFFEDNIGIVACIYPEDDYFWQQNTDLWQYEKYGRPVDELKLQNIDSAIVMIDPTSLPGNSLYVNDIWFGSTWMMWFGPDYFQFIPQERLLEFDQAYKVKILSNNTVVFQLFEEFEEVQKKESRNIQWAFRNYFRINELVSTLRQNEVRNKSGNPDPAIEIFNTNCTHGGVRLVRLYLDIYNKSVPRSQAKQQVSYELDSNGNTLWISKIDI